MFTLIPIARAGVITEAPTIADILQNVLTFLLSIVGIVSILSVVIAGLLYLGAAGDQRRIIVARRAVTYGIIGTAIAIGGLVIVGQLASFFESGLE